MWKPLGIYFWSISLYMNCSLNCWKLIENRVIPIWQMWKSLGIYFWSIFLYMSMKLILVHTNPQLSLRVMDCSHQGARWQILLYGRNWQCWQRRLKQWKWLWYRKRKRKCKRVNVNMSVYGLKFSKLYNLHLWYWNSLLYTLISFGENSTFAHFSAAIANHYNLAFLFHQVPITAVWTEAVWYERLAQHFYTWLSVWSCATTVWELQSDHIAMSAVPDIKCSLCHVH